MIGAMLPYPDKVSNLTLIQENDLVTIHWDKSKQADIESYRVYRNEAIGTPFKLLAANLVETNFKDANMDSHKYQYTVVAVIHHQQSDYSNTLEKKASWLHAPGRIESESAVEIQGSSIGRTSDVDGKFNMTRRVGIGKEAIMEYKLNVVKSGNYSLSYRVAAPRNTKGFIISVDGKELTKTQVTETGGYSDWQTQLGAFIYHKKGKRKLTLKSINENWKLNWINLKQE